MYILMSFGAEAGVAFFRNRSRIRSQKSNSESDHLCRSHNQPSSSVKMNDSKREPSERK